MKLHPNEIVLTDKNWAELLDYALSKGKSYQRAFHIQANRQNFKGVNIETFGEGYTAYSPADLTEIRNKLFPDR